MIIILIVGVYLVALFLILNFFKGVNRSCKNSITLNPVDFKRSPIGQPTMFHELNKCKEEDDEFQKAVLKNDINNAIEEFHDSIQTKLNCLDMMGIPVDVICKAQSKHYKKLLNRGFVFKEVE
ncbi:MAG: hypothetical protein MR639_15350 [Clostridium sp.]|uniref:hypothetical protein n=1 Tax=Clostridium sp. TaxID=1506 RepID=UPI002A84FD83|nr:hypothetical protein [Clostridium sp.]MDY5098531.1 hypothetical protein [Clostridium sp.]